MIGSLVLSAFLFGQGSAQPPPPPAPAPPSSAAPASRPADKDAAEEPPVVTRHEVRIGGRVLKYTVTAGMMPLRNDAGEIEGRIFFMAYTADRPAREGAARRPLMFSFNGGPGSSSVWLHLGAVGPRRVVMQPDGWLPAPPYQLVDNEHSWLDDTDVVFIDPIGTGYSRAATPELGKKFWTLAGDIESVGEFIRLYLTRYERWTSPIFLVGESYGTTRAAGLSGYLIDRGIALNGIVLVSSILNFQTTNFTKGNDLPYVVYLPTYTATAWYHKKLPAELRANLSKALQEAEAYAAGDYMVALGKGDRLTARERQVVIDALARLTGLNREFIDKADLRIELGRFNAELLREDRKTVGRLDSRFTGVNARAVSETPDFDPSLTAIRPPYTATFNNYVRTELGYKSDLPYYILGGGIGRWDFNAANQFADTSEALRSAFAKNPFMKLFIASGYYDQATPYFATQYTVAHMGLDSAARRNIVMENYEAGHMMYIHGDSLAKLKRDVAAFIRTAAEQK